MNRFPPWIALVLCVSILGGCSSHPEDGSAVPARPTRAPIPLPIFGIHGEQGIAGVYLHPASLERIDVTVVFADGRVQSLQYRYPEGLFGPGLLPATIRLPRMYLGTRRPFTTIAKFLSNSVPITSFEVRSGRPVIHVNPSDLACAVKGPDTPTELVYIADYPVWRGAPADVIAYYRARARSGGEPARDASR